MLRSSLAACLGLHRTFNAVCRALSEDSRPKLRKAVQSNVNCCFAVGTEFGNQQRNMTFNKRRPFKFMLHVQHKLSLSQAR